MKTASFCNRETGIFNGTLFLASDDEALALNTPAAHIAVEGHHDHLTKRFDIETGKVIDYTPPAPPAADVVAARKQTRSAAARAQINALESSQHRLIRECLLGSSTAKAKLQAIDDEIVSLRSQLQ